MQSKQQFAEISLWTPLPPVKGIMLKEGKMLLWWVRKQLPRKATTIREEIPRVLTGKEVQEEMMREEDREMEGRVIVREENEASSSSNITTVLPSPFNEIKRKMCITFKRIYC
mmetsp:Transcript_6112/g.8091  ORF Transcript_6112/g.8091 Transcript_6112/m.8091 type:complete len:113 (+) Transcript_6112:1401-1739(+)